MFKSHESQRYTDCFGRWVLPLLATLHKWLTQTVAIIGTKGFQLKYWPFMLTISSLTRDNYQQIRLFVDSDLLFSILCFQPVGNTFLKRTIQPSPVLVFPCLSALNNQQKKQITFFSQNWLSQQPKRKNNNNYFTVNLVFELPPPGPYSHSHISPSGG